MAHALGETNENETRKLQNLAVYEDISLSVLVVLHSIQLRTQTGTQTCRIWMKQVRTTRQQVRKSLAIIVIGQEQGNDDRKGLGPTSSFARAEPGMNRGMASRKVQLSARIHRWTTTSLRPLSRLRQNYDSLRCCLSLSITMT